MDIHNTTEDIVVAEVNAICDSLEKEGNQTGICTCVQCRKDAICYVLNRAKPHYVVSHRGLVRLGKDPQAQADITALVYEGIKRVSHNQRPYFNHDVNNQAEAIPDDVPLYNIPTIMGRAFNGLNFSPMTAASVELLQNGALSVMKDNNWQNPYALIPSAGGTFTFWPKPEPAENTGSWKIFEYTIKISGGDFAELNHIFTIPVISKPTNQSFSLSKTFKLPDLYLFPPGEEKDQLAIND